MSLGKDLEKLGTNTLKTLNTVNNIVNDLTSNNRVVAGGYMSFDALMETPISDYCLVSMADYQLRKYMMLNMYMRDITLSATPQTYGIGNLLSNEISNYTYAENNNYLNEYQKTDAKNSTTRVGKQNDNIQNYGGGSNKYFSNKLYSQAYNLFPDENDSGTANFTEAEKWATYEANTNRNSILRKTKELFRNRKIHTIIDSFHTDPSNLDLNDPTQNGSAAYGLSHGRNLLTWSAENTGTSYSTNGYDNPYCRVWTHHHQYSQKRANLIRPFVKEDVKNGTTLYTPIEQSKLHTWQNGFEEGSEWGWKKGNKEAWEMSVLDKTTGMVNITPKYVDGGRERNIHTKDCMFSIENLAWQGFDPYSFEKALSWEQRGPFGGRIMWFPPYGLTFNEDSKVNWTEHSFIGRGENVYTYTNTSRSGTLEFLMVVDHPSVLDYATWHDKKPTDTQVLRFLAGCDPLDNTTNSLLEYVKPTPLTDEYTEVDNSSSNNQEKSGDKTTDIIFFAFFPNNYSGVYDLKNDSVVDPIAYLLYGNGAQWEYNESNNQNSKSLTLPLEDIRYGNEVFNGNGYEMEASGSYKEQDDKKNYIVGTSKANKDKKFYYRIDGTYEPNNNNLTNTFGQKLEAESSYKDAPNRNLGLNQSVEAIKQQFRELGDDEEIYTLAEVAYVLTNNNYAAQLINKNVKDKLDKNNERIEELNKKIGKNSKYNVCSVNIVGYANNQGNNKNTDTNDTRNASLATCRVNTIKEWLKKKFSGNKITWTQRNSVTGNATGDSNTPDAKKWRSVKVTISLSEKKSNEEQNKIKEGKGFVNGKEVDLFTLSNEKKNNVGRFWYYIDGNDLVLYDKKVRTEYGMNTKGQNIDRNSGGNNKYRYDQEYHFFNKLKETDPMVFNSLVEKLQYFDPAFHSISGEGFLSRLTFLHQCTRQGGTVGTSDKNVNKDVMARNLAFGRPPFCILRIGDFYYQKIVINNMNISYDPLVMDLNSEGVGVVPMIAKITLSFNFIGGGDLTGPVRRLQNALSFNYYANTRLYDNRADRVEYKNRGKDWETMKNGDIDFDNSVFYDTPMRK